MHEFNYIENDLYCEDLRVSEIAESFGTPLYLYSHKTLLDHFHKLENAFRDVKPLICFSMKANSSLAVCKALIKEGAGLDVVSGGELYKALHIGADPGKIVYASVGKTASEIEFAVSSGILFFNVESIPELEIINRIAARLRKKINVSIRLNPNVEARTHGYISTARDADKFGLDCRACKEMFLSPAKFTNLNLVGLHIHIGSQIVDSEPFIKAITRAVSLIKELREKKVFIQWLNIGGGMGIVYDQEKPQSAGEFAAKVLPLLKEIDIKIILEPGRFIAGNSGILVTKVIYLKETPFKNFIIVDAAMNDLIRPALYGAHHQILPVRRSGREEIRADVVGPICESGDFLARDRKLSRAEPGELLAVMGAGAYGFTMSSNYNSRPRPAEVMVINGKPYLIRKREKYEDLINSEMIPECL